MRAGTLDEAARHIHDAQTFLMTSHINPDGDALGSVLALRLALLALGKQVTCVFRDEVPDVYKFLAGSDQVLSTHAPSGWDIALICDTGSADRVGRVNELVQTCRMVIDIDHHATEGAFGDLVVQDSTAAATAEMVYDLINLLGVPITPDIANCLLTGIITDTGKYRYPSVTPRTFSISAELVSKGGSPAYVVEEVYEHRRYVSQLLMGHTLRDMRLSEDGRIVWSVIPNNLFETLGAGDDDSEGIIHQMRRVRGTLAVILLREVKPGRFRVSVRSKADEIDVARFAERFGGGGHRAASGFNVEGTVTEAVEVVVTEMHRWMESSLSENPPA